VILLIFLLQADSARELVERLRSETVEVREEAEARLKKLGKSAAPELEKAAKDPDREVAGRAQFLLRLLAVRDELTFALKEAFPGIEEVLVKGGDGAYGAALVRAADKDKFPTLNARDLEALVLPAVRGALLPEEREAVCRVASRFCFRTAAPQILRFLSDPSPDVRGAATAALAALEARESARPILALMRDRDARVRVEAQNALKALRARSLVPEIVALLEDPIAGVRERAVNLLSDLHAVGAASALVNRLKDPDVEVRLATIEAVTILEVQDSAKVELMELLGDPQERVRGYALEALASSHPRSESLPLTRLLKDPDLQSRALSVVRRLRAKEAVPDLLRFLKGTERSLRLDAARALEELEVEEAAVPGERLVDVVDLERDVVDPHELGHVLVDAAGGGTLPPDAV